jgi:hypothetical protein
MLDTATQTAAEYVQKAIELLTGGADPAMASEMAMNASGATPESLAAADTGEMLSLLCGQPVPPAWGQYFNAVQNSYNGNGNVVVQGGGASGGGGGGGGYAPSPAEQIVYNYNSYEQNIDDRDNIFSGNFGGDIDVDQSTTDIEGDGNVVTHGDGPVNAATGDEALAQQGGLNIGQTGDGSNQQLGTGNQAVVGDNNETLQVDGSIGAGNQFEFGEGSAVQQQGNYLEEGAAQSGIGDATGQSVDTNVQSDVNEEHGPGDNIEGGFPVREPVQFDRVVQDNPEPDRGPDFEVSDNFSPQVEVNVEGGAGDQTVTEDAAE